MIATRYRLSQQVALQTRLSREIARAQVDISSRKRLQGPSDDPVAAARIAQIQRTQQDEAAWTANVDVATSLADRVDGSMTTMADNLDRAKTLMLRAANATLSAGDRTAIAIELRGIADDVAALSQEKDSRGQPLYATGAALRYPVGGGVEVTAGATRAGVFDAIATAGGPKDLSAILADAATAIETTDQTDRETATTASLAELDAASGSLADAHAELGVRSTRLAAIRERLADTKLTNTEDRGLLEDTDIDETVIALTAKMTALDAAQKALAKTMQNSLFDLI